MESNLAYKDALALAKSYHVLSNTVNLQALLESILPDKDFSYFTKFQLHKTINDCVLAGYNGELNVKQLLTNHFIEDDAVAAFEVKTNNSRLDFLRINGASIGYEIKSEIDSLKKLNKQIDDYSHLFEYNYIVLDKIHLKKARQLVPNKFGIIEAKKDQLVNLRKAKKIGRLDPLAQLGVFTKSELNKYFKVEKEAVLKHYSQSEVNEAFKAMLKERYRKKWQYLKANHASILPVDYQYFFQHNLAPSLIYGKG